MISVSGKKWEERKINNRLVEKVQTENKFSNILSKLIISRNFDENEIYLIENKLKFTNIFRYNNDFNLAAKLTENSIKKKEKICILGDYDVDGSVSTALLVRFFKSIKHPYFYYIPDRIKDGYGASKKLFQKLILKKPKLVIMVDCGSTSVEAVDFLNENKINSLIIDHHEINKPFPKSNMIINPKKNNGYSNYDYLCASTLVYFFIDLLIKRLKYKINFRRYLIYVLLATVCDVMPLRKLNRLLSIIALEEFNFKNNYIFNEIYRLGNKTNKLNINDLGYLFGPILNAGGRLSRSSYATELLSSDNKISINNITNKLIILNEKRKKIESAILKNIDFEKIKKENENIIIYFNPTLNEGLIGIIASKLKDYFDKPSIVITKSKNILKGSARSIFDYNIGKVIKNLLDRDIIITGGGHNMAAGFSLKKENFVCFKKFINQDYLKKKIKNKWINNYETELSSLSLNRKFYDDIMKLSPFGSENPNPIFLFKQIKVIKHQILDNKHISCILKSKIGITINSISFDSLNTQIGKHLINYKNYFNVIGYINENFWNNKKTLQLVIKDLIL